VSFAGLFKVAEKILPPTAEATQAATVPDPDVDQGLFVAGPPGWIWPCGLSLVILVGAAMDAIHDPHAFFKDNGAVIATILSIMLGSLLTYRGYRGRLKAKVVMAQVQATAQVASGAVVPSVGAATTTTTVTTEGPP
jgi:hypothetical protein